MGGCAFVDDIAGNFVLVGNLYRLIGCSLARAGLAGVPGT